MPKFSRTSAFFCLLQQKWERRTPFPFCSLDALPLCAACNVSDFHVHCLQLIADAVSLGEILGLLGIGALTDQCLDLGVLLAILADDGKACGRSSA